MEKKRIDPESDEYKAWKQGVTSLEEEPKEKLQEEKTTTPEKKNKGIIHWFFFGDIFSDKSDEGKMRKRYYRIMIFFYLLFCFLLVYSTEYQSQNLGEIIVLSLAVAIVLPFFLLISIPTPGVNIVVGIIASLILGGLGRLSRFVLYTLGYNISIIFPVLIGKTGKIVKHNWLGSNSTYPYIAKIDNMGMYGRSIIYKDMFAVRSYETLEIGMEVEVTNSDLWSALSILRNQPTFEVIPLKEKVVIEENKVMTLSE
mgnify:FL=1